MVISLFENFVSYSIYLMEYKRTLETMFKRVTSHSKEMIVTKPKWSFWCFDTKVLVDLFKRMSWIIPYREAECMQEEQDK